MLSSAQHQYKPQTGFYKVKVKTGASWRGFDICRLPISVGKSAHEGEKFEATLEWVKQRFDKAILSINDTLQRFNLIGLEGLAEEEAFTKAEWLGSQWLERHQASIKHLEEGGDTPAIDFKIIRWSHWLERPEFTANLEKAHRLYRENLNFRQAVETDINMFLSRRTIKNVELFRECSRRYLLEESAVFALMFSEQEAADIYPGKEIETTRIAREQNLSELLPGLEKRHFTRIDFSRNPSTGDRATPRLAPASRRARTRGR